VCAGLSQDAPCGPAAGHPYGVLTAPAAVAMEEYRSVLYFTSLLQILYKTFTNSVQNLTNSVQNLYKFCTKTYKFCTKPYKFCAKPLQILYKTFINSVQNPYKCFTNPLFYKF
jgi:hypothetical protein